MGKGNKERFASKNGLNWTNRNKTKYPRKASVLALVLGRKQGGA